MNALSPAMYAAITEAAEALKADRAVRAVVLSGEGKAFCAGIDTDTFVSSPEFLEPILKGSDHYPNLYQSPCYAWKQLEVPVICAVQGVAYGGGLQLALGADIRIAHPESRFSVMEI